MEADNSIKSLSDCLFGALYVDGQEQKYFIKLLPTFFPIAEDGFTPNCEPSVSAGFGQTFQGLQMKRMRGKLDASTQEDLCSKV